MIHKKCRKCGKIGHKPEMVKYFWNSAWPTLGRTYTDYYHEECYSITFEAKKVYSISECKNVWVGK